MPGLVQEDLAKLLEPRGHCVSIYLPTERAGGDTRQNPIRLKNALTQAEGALEDRGLRPHEIEKLLGPAAALLDDRLFWQGQGEGLALFAAEEFFEGFQQPLSFKEAVAVGHRFRVKQLLPLLGDERYYVLALSQGSVRLFAGDRFALEPMEATNLPAGLSSVVSDEAMQKQLQYRSIDPGRGARQAMFHGHGGAGEVQHDQLLRYFREVDAATADVLRGSTAPLVVAAVEYLQPIYREANTYSGLADTGVPGSPEDLSADDLHGRSWSVVAEHFQDERRQASEQLESMIGTGRASSDLAEIVRSAYEGRVSVLFVDSSAEVWGSVDRDSFAVSLDSGPAADNQDLLDQAAVATLRHGGQVYASPDGDVPAGGSIAALYRY